MYNITLNVTVMNFCGTWERLNKIEILYGFFFPLASTPDFTVIEYKRKKDKLYKFRADSCARSPTLKPFECTLNPHLQERMW